MGLFDLKESVIQREIRVMIRQLGCVSLKNPAACLERQEILPDLSIFIPGGLHCVHIYAEVKNNRYRLDQRQRGYFGVISRTFCPVFVIGCDEALEDMLNWVVQAKKGIYRESDWIYLGETTHDLHGRKR